MFAVDNDWGDETKVTLKLCDQVFGKAARKDEAACSVRKAKTKRKKKKIAEGPLRSPTTTVARKSVSKRLEGGQFRWINEQLYTMNSKQASELFASQPELYQIYHKGFSAQSKKWPYRPLDNTIHHISTLPKDWIIVDMGCGEAQLAASVPHRVHSFDLVACNDRVTVSDMSSVPLECNSVNVVVFCLSLMGTNLNDFIHEAHRILVPKGILKITEICSRIDDIDEFIKALCSYGFRLVKKENISKMFVDLQLEKTKQLPKTSPVNITLSPCLYKRR